jgi:hypothetical protein
MKPIDDETQALLTKLDEGYARIGPGDKAAADEFWCRMFEQYPEPIVRLTLVSKSPEGDGRSDDESIID